MGWENLKASHLRLCSIVDHERFAWATTAHFDSSTQTWDQLPVGVVEASTDSDCSLSGVDAVIYRIYNSFPREATFVSQTQGHWDIGFRLLAQEAQVGLLVHLEGSVDGRH